jgi:hypothetical protein
VIVVTPAHAAKARLAGPSCRVPAPSTIAVASAIAWLAGARSVPSGSLAEAALGPPSSPEARALAAADAAHERTVDEGSPSSPVSSPEPGGASGGAASGAASAAPSGFLTFAGPVNIGPPRAMRRLWLVSKPWRTTCFVLIPERPG